MKRKTVFAAVLVVALWACEQGPAGSGPGGEEGIGAMGVVVSAVTDNCSGSPGVDPTQDMAWLVVDVWGRDKDTGESIPDVCSKKFQVLPGANSMKVTGVPAGNGKQVVLKGYNSNDLEGEPDWFGQRRQVKVTQDKENPIEMVMSRYGAFTCLSAPPAFTQRVFPATVSLGDGKILITGGFSRATVDTVDTDRIALESPSDVAVIYDQKTGVVTQTSNPMTAGRAGHAAVYLPLPDGEKVLIFGGTTKMTMQLGNGFPFSIDSADSLNSYEVFDVQTMTFTEAGEDQEGHPKQMMLKRAFLGAVRLFDNSVLITGGGEWPSDLPDYKRAEIWLPEEDGGNGGLQDLGLASPWMMTQHNGAAVTKLEDTSEGLSRYLILGGTDDSENVLEVYRQSSRQKEGVSGTFLNMDAAGLDGLYFGSLTPLSALIPTAEKMFVAIGGVTHDGGGAFSMTNSAYLLSVDPDYKVSVSPIADATCAGRFFHTASQSFVPGRAVLLGGFTDFSGVASGETCMVEAVDGKPKFTQLVAGQEPFVSRAGHRTEVLADDTLLVVGGMVTKDTLSGDTAGMLELYSHPWISINYCD